MAVSSLNEALANYSVIVAQLIEKRTYAESMASTTGINSRS